MATKNLARTVIEGGRARANCWERRYSNSRIRSQERDVQRRLRRETEFEDVVIPVRAPVHRGFHDKLGPTKRWLDSQVGRPWDLVRSELFHRFDTRTTPGRHIVYDHMLPSVGEGGCCNLQSGWVEFTVDRHGILRRTPRRRWASRLREKPLPRSRTEVEGWLDGRRVGARGTTLFWFTPTATGAYRQDRRLSDEESAFWNALPGWFRERNDPTAPNRAAATTN